MSPLGSGLTLTVEQVNIQPSLETVQQVLSTSKGSPKAPNLVPLCASIPADLLTPSLAYLKVSAQ